MEYFGNINNREAAHAPWTGAVIERGNNRWVSVTLDETRYDRDLAIGSLLYTQNVVPGVRSTRVLEYGSKFLWTPSRSEATHGYKPGFNCLEVVRHESCFRRISAR